MYLVRPKLLLALNGILLAEAVVEAPLEDLLVDFKATICVSLFTFKSLKEEEEAIRKL